MKLKFWEKEKPPERTPESEQINSVVGCNCRNGVNVTYTSYLRFKRLLQYQRELYKIETFECQGCLDTGHVIKPDIFGKLFYCTNCNKNGDKYYYGNY